MNLFWKIFVAAQTLFFAIPFPMLIYYNASYGKEDGVSGPWMAMVCLLLSVILWGSVLWLLFRRLVLKPFREKKILEHVLDKGARVEGLILESEIRGRRANGSVIQYILFSLRNFSGEEIRDAMVFIDIRPGERRFEAGKKVMLRIDKEMKRLPAITLEEARPKLRPVLISLYALVCLALAAAVAWYYIFSYQLQNNGSGWRFLVLYHPLVLCPAILLGAHLGLDKLMDLLTAAPKNGLELKYYGRRAEASVMSVAETGTYINEQPQIRFELSYTDHQGRTHAATLKRIVPLMQLNLLQVKTLPIFYLGENPSQVALVEDVDGK